MLIALVVAVVGAYVIARLQTHTSRSQLEAEFIEREKTSRANMRAAGSVDIDLTAYTVKIDDEPFPYYLTEVPTVTPVEVGSRVTLEVWVDGTVTIHNDQEV